MVLLPLLLSFSGLADVAAFTVDDVVKLHGNFMTEEQLDSLRGQLIRAGDSSGRHLQGHFSATIDQLFANRDSIDRTVESMDNGVIATTTSSDEYVAGLIKTHVADMVNLESPIRQGDPLFVSLFENIEQTSLQVEYVDAGVRATHLGTTDCGVVLVKDHADNVSRFIDTGIRRPNFSWTEPEVCSMPPSSIVVDNNNATPMPTTDPVAITKAPTASPNTITLEPTITTTQTSTPPPPTQSPTKNEPTTTPSPLTTTTALTGDAEKSVGSAIACRHCVLLSLLMIMLV